MKKKRRINGQKIFSFISLIFILTCCIWFGGRAIYFYMESHKSTKSKEVTLAKKLMTGNKSLKKVGDDYYYYQNVNNNYVSYSNLLFRILKITKDNKLILITDAPITSLAFGTDIEFDNSPILNWLNKNSTIEDSGILENSLNQPTKYLDRTETCIDNIRDIKNITCKKKTDNIVSILSVEDYINSGSTKSFINNGYYTYLANENGDGEKWIINDAGKLTSDDGSGIYGIKAVITLKSTSTLSKGNGTKDNPYRIDGDKTYFGSYVQLDKDVWRVYEEDDKLIKLSLDNYLRADDMDVKHIYSNSNSFHNDTTVGSLAYYLNTTYLKSLSYSNLVVTNNYDNGYYNEDEDYDYKTSLNKKADTKVANLSIGNIVLNNSLDNYFMSTGLYDKSDYVYLSKKNGTMDTIKVTKEANIVPCISIEKNKLVKGSGTKDDPYRTE